MDELKELRIGENALLASFMRVMVGREFDVAGRLRGAAGAKRTPSYYTCYGHYDLVELLTVDSYEAMHDLPFDRDIIDSEFSLFYSWANISHPIEEWIEDYPVLVFVLLKIQPCLEEKLTFNVERQVINYLMKTFGDDINFFTGMGRSELLLLLRGRAFSKLLTAVSKLRQDLIAGEIITDKSIIGCDLKRPIFIDSTTFPLIKHPYLIGEHGYDHLEGDILPMVNIICNPGYEKIIAQKKPASCAGVYNFYGNYDAILTWMKPIPLSQFAKEITEFRGSIQAMNGVKSTHTTFLGTGEIKCDTPIECSALEGGFRPTEIPGTDTLRSLLGESNNLFPMVRSRLLELFGRLNSYYMQEHAKGSFEDMTGIHLPIEWGLSELKKIDKDVAHRLNNYISVIIDLCNNAIFQRYEGLETHFETCKHLPFPFLRGINGFITAATCIPCFIFKNLDPAMPTRKVWPGFVVFGQSYSYHLFNGSILSYPADSLQKPIRDWWGITHEVAHAIYRLTGFYDDLPSDITTYLKDVEVSPASHIIDIEEIYANWFDFTYIFERNKDRYFPIIWKSWLRWDRVWRYKDQYLLRSFLIYLTLDMDGIKAAQNRSYEDFLKYSKSKYFEMRDLILSAVPGFKKFIEEKNVTEEELRDLSEIARRSEHLLNYLHYVYFDQAMYDRINPSYPEELLKAHLGYLDQGLIITDEVPNPIKLLHRLYDTYTALGKDVPLRTTAATVLTLWLKYIRDYRS